MQEPCPACAACPAPPPVPTFVCGNSGDVVKQNPVAWDKVGEKKLIEPAFLYTLQICRKDCVSTNKFCRQLCTYFFSNLLVYSFPNPMVAPAVIMGPPTFDGTHPGVAQIAGVLQHGEASLDR